MSQLEAYQRALDAFPELPKPTPGCQYLSQLLPSEQIRQTFQNLNTPLDLRMKIGTVSLLLIPVDQLQHHKNQRELDETHARSICDSFGQNPATHMTTNPGIAIVDNPEIFPALTSSESVWKLTDRSVTFTVLAGQHRVEALKYFAQKYGIETKNVFWVFKILHPCFLTDNGFVECVMLEDNLTHISTKNSIQHELSVVVDRFHSSYSTCDTQRLHQCLHAIDATRPVGIKKMFGGDKDSKHIISRILTCRYIVEALHRTRLGLAPSHTPSHDHDERFYADGSQYHIWWKQPSQLIYVLYFLQSLNLGPLAAAIIYSNAEIIRRIQCQLDFDLEERHFTENPIRIDEPDVKEILEEVATTWNAPILLLFPGHAKSPQFFRERLPLKQYIHTFHALNVISLGIQQHNTTKHTKNQGSLDHPQLPTHNFFDSLNPQRTTYDRERINGKILRLLGGGVVGTLSTTFNDEVLQPLNQKLGTKIGFTFHGVRVCSSEEKELMALVMSLMSKDRGWHDLVESTEAIGSDRRLFGSPLEAHIMPEKPSNADDHELSQDQAQEMERLASSQIDVYSKIEGIKLRTNQEVNALDEQLHQLQAQVQELIEKQREAILQETELQRAILALQDQRQTAEEEVGKTQLLIQTLDSEKAATIAGLPERMAPLQRTIEHVQEQLQAVHRLSPSLTSQQGDHPPSTFVPLPDPDELTFAPEFAKHFLKTEDLKSLHIAVEPLCNLVHAYVSLPPASRDVFSDRNTCTASVQWALTRSPDKRRHREPEDSDDESAVPTTPHKKAKTSLSQNAQPDLAISPELFDILPLGDTWLGDFTRYIDHFAGDPTQYLTNDENLSPLGLSLHY